MKMLKIFSKKKNTKKKTVDYYQETLEQFGRDQLQRIAERGLGIRVRVV